MESTNQVAGSRDEIARQAYQLWEQKGCPEGHDVDFWLEAEQKVISADTTLHEQQTILAGRNPASSGMELEIRQTPSAIRITRLPSKPTVSPAKAATTRGKRSPSLIRG